MGIGEIAGNDAQSSLIRLAVSYVSRSRIRMLPRKALPQNLFQDIYDFQKARSATERKIDRRDGRYVPNNRITYHRCGALSTKVKSRVWFPSP